MLRLAGMAAIICSFMCHAELRAGRAETTACSIQAPDVPSRQLTGKLLLASLTWGEVNTVELGALDSGKLTWTADEGALRALSGGVKLLPFLQLVDGRPYVGADMATALAGQPRAMDPEGLLRLAMTSIAGGGCEEWPVCALPARTPRKLTLLDHSGAPAPNVPVTVSLLLGRYNHCAYPTSLPLASATTGMDGTVTFQAPPGTAWIGCPGFVPSQSVSDGATPLTLEEGFQLELAPAMTLRAHWAAPEQDFSVTISRPEILSRWVCEFDACLNTNGCGANCAVGNFTWAKGHFKARAALAAIRSLTILCRQSETGAAWSHRLSGEELGVLRTESTITLSLEPSNQ